MTEPTNAVVPASGSSLLGGGQASADQLILPRTKIVQQMSKERVDGLAEPGEFFNTLTSEAYGPDIKFLILVPFMNRVLLVRDEKRDRVQKALGGVKLSEGDGLKCRSNDMIQGRGEPGIACAACPLSKWEEETSTPPLCTEVYNFAALHESGDLVILQFQRSSAKVGKKLNSMLRFGGLDQQPWTRFYRAETHEESGKKGPFFVPVVTKMSEAPPQELLGQANRWAAELGAVGPIDVTPPDEDELDDEATGTKGPF